ESHPLDFSESHHHICDLHPGVIDVVLDLDCLSCGSQHPDGCVTKNCITKVTFMSRLIRIDCGVLDDDLAAQLGLTQLRLAERFQNKIRAIQIEVKVPCACDIGAR